ncbi:hypothetical protein BV25DRAFT_1827440 [Artomyces pyxidatus]|uniref:Uncharacterized protein n=1 Tax=Artomyces pyxidatus TaxID=48021 RepID=A0ACB8SW96_9AGAM|nr:hypothetical protein BV25DRAFT_1827440 [Artomyces pyxidatus]
MDAPPPFSHDDHDDVDLVGNASPLYSPEAAATERVLQTSADAHPPSPFHPLHHQTSAPSSAQTFVYRNNFFETDLGPNVWGLRQPAYGHNAIVHGSVKLAQKCTHVFRLEATLLGVAKVTASTRGMITDVLERPLVSSQVTLFTSCPSSGYCPTDHTFTFTIPFPSFVNGETSPLPPSYMTWSPGLSCEILYSLRIDVSRKGLRRHENTTIPVLYLPKTWPSLPSSPSEPFKNIALPPIWPADACPRFKARAVVPSVQLILPATPIHPSGALLPVTLTFTCPAAPALVRLLAQSASIALVKRTIAHTKEGALVAGRETPLAKGTPTGEDSAREGVARAHYALALGAPGKEQSWRVHDALEVAYFVRVTLRTGGSATNYVPSYSHDECVYVATEPGGTREREELQLGGTSAPAIGMSHPRLELRPTHSMTW